MYRPGVILSLIALAALSLAPELSFAQALTEQVDRPASGHYSASYAAASRDPGSGADEFTRGRRHNRGGSNKGGNNKHDKPDNHGVCHGKKSENQLCIPIPTNIGICQGPLGKCSANSACLPVDTVSGCPCLDDPNNEGCLVGLDSEYQKCLNPLQKCKCEEGKCVPNYLPRGTACMIDNLGPCEVGKCKGNGKCSTKQADPGTTCFKDEEKTGITCLNAGSCDENGSCEEFGCKDIISPCSTNSDCEGGLNLCCAGVCVAKIGALCPGNVNDDKVCCASNGGDASPGGSLLCKDQC